jgi:hypothetical protein
LTTYESNDACLLLEGGQQQQHNNSDNKLTKATQLVKQLVDVAAVSVGWLNPFSSHRGV